VIDNLPERNQGQGVRNLPEGKTVSVEETYQVEKNRRGSNRNSS